MIKINNNNNKKKVPKSMSFEPQARDLNREEEAR
jgi:hypothetical protein